MKKVLLSVANIVVVTLVAAMLVSCGPVYRTQYNYEPPKGDAGKQCINRCIRNKSVCKMTCQTNYQNCVAMARNAAYPEYFAYVAEQQRQNLTVWRQIDDFADLSSCKKDCGCDDDYRQCYTLCGGQVTSERICVANCGK